MSDFTTSTRSVSTQYPGRWKWLLALGALLLVLGLAGAGVTALLVVTSVLVFGPLLLVGSLMQFLTAMFAEKRNETVLHIISAGVELVLGFIIMANPQMSSALVVLIAFCLVVMGLTRLAHAPLMQTPQLGWLVMAGAVGLLLGVLLAVAEWLKVPARGVWLIAVCLSLDFACHGVSWAALALMERRRGRELL